MADNANSRISTQAAAQSMTAQMASAARPSIFAGNDPKRMSFDGNLPGYGLSQSPRSFGLTSGLLGGTPNYNRDRRDSLKGLVHLDDFGTD